MPFDHTAAAAQVSGIVDYIGRECTLEGHIGTVRVIFDVANESATLGDFGTTETVEVKGTFSRKNFPSAPPRFGSTLTRLDDDTRYVVGVAASGEGHWSVTLQQLGPSTPPTINPFPV